MSKNTPFTPNDVPDLSGKVAIVTGGSRSIGLETVYLLLRKNCTVYIGGRSQSGYDNAKKNLSSRTDITSEMVERLQFHELDLAKMTSAKASAEAFIQKHGHQLDIVICNAGISMQKGDQLSPEGGYELMFNTNHLGHFAFVTSLLPLIEKTAKEHGEARVVVTSSDAHAFAKEGIDFDSLTQTVSATGFRGMSAALNRYGVSKLCNMLFTRELDHRWASPLRKSGVKVFVDCAHPGTILDTSLGGTGSQWGIPPIVNRGVRLLSNVIGFTSQEGAMTQTFVATHPSIKSEEEHGKYYVPQSNWRGRYVSSQLQKPDTKWGEDDELAAKLWDYSEEAMKKVGC